MSLTFLPTRFELSRIHKLLEMAERSSKLLQERYLILDAELIKVREELAKNYANFDRMILDSYGDVNEAESIIGPNYFMRVAASCKRFDDVLVGAKNVRGTIIPMLSYNEEIPLVTNRGYYLQDSDPKIDDAYVVMRRILASLVRYAQLISDMKVLQREERKVELRYRALDKVLIPKLKKERDRISFKIEELEREEVSRNKRIKERMRDNY